MKSLMIGLVALTFWASGSAQNASTRTLDIYFIDVEGGCPRVCTCAWKLWENALEVMTQDGLQLAYNCIVQDCDLFVVVLDQGGKYTREEFETAFRRFPGDA